jgi:hypothetical protein
MSENNLQTDDGLEDSFELPEKYRGKSAQDVAKMHMDAEKEKSRLANELGTLRSLSDQLLGLQQAKTVATREQRKPLTADDLLNSPEESLEKAIGDNPEVAQTRQELVQLRTAVAQSKFERQYPDYNEDLQNPEFVDWVKSNKVRTQLGMAANQGNYDAASDLWQLWDERQSDLREVKTQKLANRKQAEKLGTLEGSGTSGLESEKIYSRSDMMLLQQRALSGDSVAKAKWNDPTFQAERLRAYADKRVK